MALLAELQASIQRLGAPFQITFNALLPSQERQVILEFLLERFLEPDRSIQELLKEVPEVGFPQGAAPDDLSAFRLQRLLHSLGISVTADAVRGCVAPEESLRLLQHLAELALVRQQLNQQLPRDQGEASSSGRQPHITAACCLPEMRLADAVTDQLQQLLSQDAGLWFPSDLNAAAQRHLAALSSNTGGSIVDPVAEVTRQLALLQQHLPQLEASAAQLSQQVELCSAEGWEQQRAALCSALSTFLESSDAFYATFCQGLGVWCRASAAVDTPGLGAAAAGLLARFQPLQAMLDNLGLVRRHYMAIVSCAPPLQGLEAGPLRNLTAAAQQELQRIAAETETLRLACQAAQRQLGDQAPSAPKPAAYSHGPPFGGAWPGSMPVQ